MIQPNDMSYSFLTTNEYWMGTPALIADSDRAVDIPFPDLARNYELQEKLRLASAALIRPVWVLAHPLDGEELVRVSASYLAAFTNHPEASKIKRDYLANGGLVRILIKDEKLLEEVRQVMKKAQGGQ